MKTRYFCTIHMIFRSFLTFWGPENDLEFPHHLGIFDPNPHSSLKIDVEIKSTSGIWKFSPRCRILFPNLFLDKLNTFWKVNSMSFWILLGIILVNTPEKDKSSKTAKIGLKNLEVLKNLPKTMSLMCHENYYDCIF